MAMKKVPPSKPGMKMPMPGKGPTVIVAMPMGGKMPKAGGAKSSAAAERAIDRGRPESKETPAMKRMEKKKGMR